MCGISGFLSNDRWRFDTDVSWVDVVVHEVREAVSRDGAWEDIQVPLQRLMDRFDDLMSFGFHLELVQSAELFGKLRKLVDLLDLVLNRIERFGMDRGMSETLERLAEQIRDHTWQLREEVMGNAERTSNLISGVTQSNGSPRARHHVAWAVQQVIENLDRLEVRGRDSAGIAIQCLVSDPPGDLTDHLGYKSRKENEVQIGTGTTKASDGGIIISFAYKVANLVGRLGDNTAALTRAIREDDLLWQVAGITDHVNVMAHTRWASNGIISLANCHPVDGFLMGKEHDPSLDDTLGLFVLNGDVDNYTELVERYVRNNGYEIDPAITTDAKILPVFYRLGTNPGLSPADRFSTLMRTCEGSLAIVMQHPLYPRDLFIGQKGSGQSLFLGKVKDGFILASEVYGLASRTRSSYALSGTDKGGTQVVLSADSDEQGELWGRFLEDGSRFHLEPEPIYIHSRDIYRGSYDYYFEKEIHQSASSVRKTIAGKYRKDHSKIQFITEGTGSFGRLMSRFRDPSRPPIRRIMVIGQGTASIAADGVAHLLRLALARSRIVVGSCKASEMSGFLSEQPLDDMLVVAISQSGTTTDTNRTVDVAGSKGAWVHAVVNRRNSPLVSKAHSHSYTSDGRDVEMAVASTKAFYSQVAAGKLIALLLAAELKTLTDGEIFQEIEDLERLPADIEWVLDQKEFIREVAETFGPTSRNWAVVGNGPNKVAADEIRIKLSELCYKSIPCDFTEDKKHIDLSTEPLTIVVANDLPDPIVQDTAKEVAIFKAHSGKPIVLCGRGEKRFNKYAERVIELPLTGGGLKFVPATVAGHLWGFYAAKAIDAGAERLRKLRAELAEVLTSQNADPDRLDRMLMSTLEHLASGKMNAALGASTVASLAVFAQKLRFGIATGDVPSLVEEGMFILNAALEDATRPIDTIRHQAKTVTVGISRPQEVLPQTFAIALEQLGMVPGQLRDQDRRLLRIVSPIIAKVNGGILYKVAKAVNTGAAALAGKEPWIEVAARFGSSQGRPSRYDTANPAGGSKRTALRVERIVWSPGRSGMESLVVVPVFEEETHECDKVVLFHLEFLPQASVDQKLGILKAMGDRYNEVIERLEELSSTADLEDFLEKVTPRDLMLLPIDSLILSHT